MTTIYCTVVGKGKLRFQAKPRTTSKTHSMEIECVLGGERLVAGGGLIHVLPNAMHALTHGKPQW